LFLSIINRRERLPAGVDIAYYESNPVADNQTGEAGNEY
jgi:hypothetical protein